MRRDRTMAVLSAVGLLVTLISVVAARDLQPCAGGVIPCLSTTATDHPAETIDPGTVTDLASVWVDADADVPLRRKLSGGGTAGGVVGVILFVLIIAAFIWCCCTGRCCCGNNSSQANAAAATSTSVNAPVTVHATVHIPEQKVPTQYAINGAQGIQAPPLIHGGEVEMHGAVAHAHSNHAFAHAGGVAGGPAPGHAPGYAPGHAAPHGGGGAPWNPAPGTPGFPHQAAHPQQSQYPQQNQYTAPKSGYPPDKEPVASPLSNYPPKQV